MNEEARQELSFFDGGTDGRCKKTILPKLFTSSSNSFNGFHRNNGPFRWSWLLRMVKDPDLAEVSTMRFAASLRSFRFVGEVDDDA